MLVEAATDNKNRTYPEVRHAFSKNGGTIAEPGSVAFQFERKGRIVAAYTGDPDEALLAALEAGAEDAEMAADGTLLVTTDQKELHAVRTGLMTAGMDVTSAELAYQANNTITVEDNETAQKIVKLMNALDELDDVVATHSNFDIADSIQL